jgi:hypothetical protein
MDKEEEVMLVAVDGVSPEIGVARYGWMEKK